MTLDYKVFTQWRKAHFQWDQIQTAQISLGKSTSFYPDSSKCYSKATRHCLKCKSSFTLRVSRVQRKSCLGDIDTTHGNLLCASRFLKFCEVLKIPCQVFSRKGWKCGSEVRADDICVLALRKRNYLHLSRTHHPTQLSTVWNSNQPFVQKDKSSGKGTSGVAHVSWGYCL